MCIIRDQQMAIEASGLNNAKPLGSLKQGFGLSGVRCGGSLL